MGKLAFVFPGQGTQYSGMGKSVCENFEVAKAVFDQADAIRGETSRQCFAGTQEELKSTINTQPCIYAVENALAVVLREKGIVADMVAGYSLGELCALTYANVFSFDKGFPLVCSRAEIMTQAAIDNPGKMAAVAGLDNAKIDELCKSIGKIYQVNFNCPERSTVAGQGEEIEKFIAAVNDCGGRAQPLAVSGAFHSVHMNSAAEAFEPILRKLGMKEPQIPVYGNYMAAPYAGDMPRLLAQQICCPVRWQASVERMAADGADTFVEVGPGKTLSGFIRKILPDAKILRCDTAESIDDVVKSL